MAVKVYTTPTCPWCKRTKAFLKENKVKFTEVDVSKNEKAAMEAVKKSGQRAVPVIDFNGTVIVGFDEEKLKKLIKKK